MVRPSLRLQTFLDQASTLVQQDAVSFTAHERFQMLLEHGLDALRAGSYGIAACYVVRGRGTELTLFGHNTLSKGDPHGHAEMHAVRLAADTLHLPERERADALRDLVRAGLALIRSAETEQPTTELFSTLEPCPMCTVNAINAGVGTVTYAASDPLAGALAPERLEGLAPLWRQTALEQCLQVHICQTERPLCAQTYVPAPLLETLTQLFEVSREDLDRRLAGRGFFQANDLLGPARDVVAAEQALVSR